MDTGFRTRSCSIKKTERDDVSKRRHPACRRCHLRSHPSSGAICVAGKFWHSDRQSAGPATSRRPPGRIVMSDMRTVTGGCHCGLVRFEAPIDMASAIACNCSICQKKGLLLTFVPEERSCRSGRTHDLPVRQQGHSTYVLQDVRRATLRQRKGSGRHGDGGGQSPLCRRRRPRGNRIQAVRRAQHVSRRP